MRQQIRLHRQIEEIAIMNVNVIDVFCGAGGLSHGFYQEGMNILAGVDSDPACRTPFELNNEARFIEADVAELDYQVIGQLYPESGVRALIGCAPCQPFSSYSLGQACPKDRKWGLLGYFAELVERLRPEIVSMENVAMIQRHQIYNDFLEVLQECGYSVDAKDVYCPDYGIPQTRTRHVLLASTLGEIQIPEPTHDKESYRTVKDAIGHLPPINAGEVSDDDPLHRTSRLSELNMKRMKASKPGGTWRDWDEELVAPCHKKSSGKTFPGVYGRMEWDKPSPTITTQCFGFGNGRFGHPEQDRAISLREAALFQTFPEDYQFIAQGENVQMKTMGRMIGNAVPVRLGQILAQAVNNHLREVHEKKSGG